MRNKEKLQKAIELRHEIHQNPDLSNEERPTYERIIKFLKENAPSIEIVDKGYYVYAIYHSEHPERPRIAFRTEVDALPIEDLIDEPYKSCKPGVGHKCGHDGHAATMCALAMELDEFGAERDVYMIFQPAEETGDGARQCTDFITDNNIAEIYGMHGSIDEDYGVVQTKAGLMNCASEGMCIEYKGVSTHASLPELGKNPTLALAKLALYCDELEKSEGYKGLIMSTVCYMRSGDPEAYGVAAHKGCFQVTLRGSIEAEMVDLEKKVEAKAKELAEELSGAKRSLRDYTAVIRTEKLKNETDLLALVIICPGVEHVPDTFVFHHRRSLGAAHFPGIFRLHQRPIDRKQGPFIRSIITSVRSLGHSHDLVSRSSVPGRE